jgi:predicted O-methyltransferase YrrM
MASARVPDSSLDFVYIDAGHDYNNVKCDLAAWAPKVRPGGIIVGDDYGGPSDKVGKFGVKKAVTEAFGDKVKVERYRIWWTRK